MKPTALASLLRSLISVAMLAAMSSISVTVLAQTADRPTLKVGDRWEYEVHVGSSRVKSIGRSREITAVTPDQIRGTENGSAFVMSTDLNNVESPVRKDSDLRLLSFPLEVGKKWSFSDQFVDKSLGDVEGRSDGTVEVVGYEKVSVPAGEFDAFKMQTDAKRASGGARAEESWTYWYSPAVRAVVKWDYKVITLPSRTVYESVAELTEYKLQR
jgi:hypothetical protein